MEHFRRVSRALAIVGSISFTNSAWAGPIIGFNFTVDTQDFFTGASQWTLSGRIEKPVCRHQTILFGRMVH